MPFLPRRDLPELPGCQYRIERLLAEGGMGSVYAGRDLALDRPVAIKVIRADFVREPGAHERFIREIQTIARLQHPAIVTVFGSGLLKGGAPYLVMELVRGVDLRRELESEGALDPLRVSRILVTVCEAMEAAHREGIHHGDLKPENILLPDDGVEAKVVDFGVAQAIRGQPGMPNDIASAPSPVAAAAEAPIVGTPAYMAPEQLRGQPPDSRTDVFSLGVIAYEMLCGALPFGGGSVAEVALAQAHGAALGDVGAPALARAVALALSFDADRRPAGAQALAHLIGAAAAGL
jgi:serine/threonine protein kinase